MAAGMSVVLVSLIIIIPLFALFVYLLILAVRALRKYIKSGPARKEAKTVRTTLGEKLRENRVRCKLSQEFVAEAVGVSRQAVSKWENPLLILCCYCLFIQMVYIHTVLSSKGIKYRVTESKQSSCI